MLSKIRLNQIQQDGASSGDYIKYNGSSWINSAIVSADISDLTENVQDIVGAFSISGTGITVTYNDGSNTLTFAVDTAVVATDSNTLTFTNKTLTSPTINTPTIVVNDNVFTLQDDGDTTKKAKFELSGIGASTTRTFTFPNANGTFALTSDLTGFSPAGSTGNIQFNSGSSTFAANSNINIDNGNTKLIIGTTIGSSAADAILDIVSTTKGLLPPRMTTTQRDAISTPTNGLVLYNSTTNAFTIRANNNWVELGTDGTKGDITVSSQGTILTVVSSSTSVAGKIEIATTAETTTGTDTVRAVTPSGLAGSIYGIKTVAVLVSDPNGSAITTGDGKAYFRINSIINGMNLINVGASVSTVSSSGTITVQIRRVRSGSPVDMLTTALTIDVSETDSNTAAIPYVINTTNDDVLDGDQIYIDIDGAGTGAKGLCITFSFQTP